MTRVLLDASDGEESWGSIGVSARTSSRRAGRRSSTRSSTGCSAPQGPASDRGCAALRRRSARWRDRRRLRTRRPDSAARRRLRPHPGRRRGEGLACRRRRRRAARPSGLRRRCARDRRDGARRPAPARPVRARQGRRRGTQLPRSRRGAQHGDGGRADPLPQAVDGGDRAGCPHRLPGPLDARRLRGRAGAGRRPALQGRRAGRRGSTSSPATPAATT